MAFFLIRPPLLLHLIINLLCFGYMLIHQVDSRTTGSSNLSCIDTDRFALLNFKSSLVLDSERNLTDWTHENIDCCRWEGIHCTKAGRVVKIDLRGPSHYYNDLGHGHGHIGGEISSSLLHLPYLSYLDLSNNYFTQVPEFFGSLKRLRDLNVSNNPLVGKVPHQLGNLSFLESLDLHIGYDVFYSQYDEHIQVDSFAWVAGLTSLKYLDMSYIRMASAKDWVESILKLPSLTTLYIKHTDLPFPAPTKMNSSTSLEVVDLSYSYHLNIIALSPLLKASTKLVDLSFSTSNQQSCLFPDYMVKLISIKYLDLSSSGLKGAIPETFNNLSNLITLDLSGNYDLQVVSPHTFSNLTNLITLDMSYINIEGAVHDYLSELVAIKYLHLTECGLKGTIPQTFSNLSNLITLDLSVNELEGVIPQTFGNLSNLIKLDLSYNKLEGVIPSGSNSLQELRVSNNKLKGALPNLSKFPNIQMLNLANNEFKGGLPPKFLQWSSNLIKLDVSSNHFRGTLTESFFLNLTNLQLLSLSFNVLTLNFSTRFIPPFKLQVLKLGACKLGKVFPHWLRTQKNLTELDISDSGISDDIPSWFWNMSSRLRYLNVSHNSIGGHLPQDSLSSCEVVDLSSNRFYGTLPSFSDRLNLLDLSSNAFFGGITSLCSVEGMRLMYLDLSNNDFSGILPNCWKNFEALSTLDLTNNTFIGSLPNSIGLISLMALFLGNNKFSGNLPQSLKNCTQLSFLDLGNNQFSGKVPDWIGTSVTELAVLRLNSNNFEGNITSNLCRLKRLQILDLSSNNISGTIPSCLNNFTTMTYNGTTFGHYVGTSLFYGGNEPEFSTVDYFTTFVYWKGHQLEFNRKPIDLLRLIDLSSNILNGLIPEELTSLDGLGSLNLSHNVLIGSIPSRIGQMRMLEALDLSHNLISGEIPLSITKLTTLNYLDLSFNQLNGSIPVSTQLSTFDATRFMENLGLCGDPLPSCYRGKNVNIDSQYTEEEEDNKFPWMYISTSLGFIVGFWGVCGTLLIKKSWAEWYFQCLTHITERLHVAILIGLANLRRKFTN